MILTGPTFTLGICVSMVCVLRILSASWSTIIIAVGAFLLGYGSAPVHAAEPELAHFVVKAQAMILIDITCGALVVAAAALVVRILRQEWKECVANDDRGWFPIVDSMVYVLGLSGGIMAALISTINAAEPVPDCPGRDVFAAVDATTPYDQQDRDVIMVAFGKMAASMHIGDRLHIVTVAESADKSALLFDGCVPGAESAGLVDGLWQALFVPPGQAKADFFAEAGKAVEPVLFQRHETPATALAETVAYHAPADEIWLFTDLLDSFSVRVRALLAGEAAIAVPLPHMQGVVAHIAGVGRYHDDARRPLTDIEMEHLLAAWRAWFAGAGMVIEVAK